MEKLGGNSRILKMPGEISLEDYEKENWFPEGHILHFDAEALRDIRKKEAQYKAIEYAREREMLISFFPNLQSSLWNNEMMMKLAVEEFLPLVDIVEVSGEELEFVAGTTNVEEAAEVLLQGQTKLFIYIQEGDTTVNDTPESFEVMVFTRHSFAEKEGDSTYVVKKGSVVENFVDSFLWRLCRENVTPEMIEKLDSGTLRKFLEECLK